MVATVCRLVLRSGDKTSAKSAAAGHMELSGSALLALLRERRLANWKQTNILRLTSGHTLDDSLTGIRAE